MATFGAASLLPRGLAILATLLITPLAIARLGVAEYGFWVLATQLPNMIMSPDLGLTQGLVNELGTVSRREGGLATQRVRLYDVQRLLTAISIGWLLLGLAAILVYGGVPLRGDGDRLLVTTMCAGLVAFVVGIPPMVWTRAQLAQERGHEYVLMEGAGKGVSLVLSIAVLLLLPPSPVTLVLAYMGPTAAAAWLNAWRYRRSEFSGPVPGTAKISIRRVFQSERQLFKTGGLFVVMQLAYVLGTAIDPYLVGAFTDSSEVAYVNVLKRPFDVLPLLVVMIAPALWPMFQRLREARRYTTISRLLLALTTGSALAIGLGSIVLIAAREPLYDFLGAGAVTPSMVDLIASAAFVIAMSIAMVLNSYLQAAGLLKAQSIVLLVGAIITLAFKVVALTFMGLTAYLVTAAAGYLIVTTLPLSLLTARSIMLSRRDTTAG